MRSLVFRRIDVHVLQFIVLMFAYFLFHNSECFYRENIKRKSLCFQARFFFLKSTSITFSLFRFLFRLLFIFSSSLSIAYKAVFSTAAYTPQTNIAFTTLFIIKSSFKIVIVVSFIIEIVIFANSKYLFYRNTFPNVLWVSVLFLKPTLSV